MLSVLANWSHTKCITRFDSACCNSTIRSTVLNLFAHDGLTMTWPFMLKYCKKDDFYSWVMQRNVKLLQGIFIVPDHFKSETELLYTIKLCKIRSLGMGSGANVIYPVNFKDIINSCDDLTHLALSSPSVTDDWCSGIIARLSKLWSLKIGGTTFELTPNILQILASVCRNLRIIYFQFKSDGIIIVDKSEKSRFIYNFKNNLTHLLRVNENMTTIFLDISQISEKYFIEQGDHCVDTWDLVQIVSKMCPVVESCDLTYSGFPNIKNVASLFLNNTSLSNFSMLNYCVQNKNYYHIRFQKYPHKTHILCSGFVDMDNQHQFHNEEMQIQCLFSLQHFFSHVVLKNIDDLSSNLLHKIICNNSKILVHLNILQCGSNWSFSTIIAALKTCKLLTSLKLNTCCHHISNDDFKRMCSTSNILKTLAIHNSSNITTRTLIEIVNHSKCLASLHYQNCDLVRDIILNKNINNKHVKINDEDDVDVEIFTENIHKFG